MIDFDLSRLSDRVLALLIGALAAAGAGSMWLPDALQAEARRCREGGDRIYLALPDDLVEAEAWWTWREMLKVCLAIETRAAELGPEEGADLEVESELGYIIARARIERVRDLRQGRDVRPN